jgi:hypothetical protein
LITRRHFVRSLTRARDGAPSREGERGSALVIALLVAVILMLLGVAFLLMGETENRIAQNEKRSAQAFYVAEAGARAVKRWFDRPDTALHFPTPGVVDRTLRKILDETDPEDPAKATAADGVVGSYPYYKQSVDLNSDGTDDLLDRPHRGGSQHSLMGIADGPDIRIDASQPAALSFLTDLTESLVDDFPGESGGVFSRIERIDIYAPPYVEVGGTWSRYGLATVKVRAQLLQSTPEGEQVLATREVELVLGEAPYRGPYGPLHSCRDLAFTNNSGLTAHWGVISAVRKSKLTLGPAPTYLPNQIADSLPRQEPSIPGVDPLWNGIDSGLFDAWVNAIDGRTIDDPWLRVTSGEEILGAPSGVRPWPPDDSPPVTDWEDHSGLAQFVPLVVCPEFDYEIWKQVATSGESDVRYFVWAGGEDFRENGTGPAVSFEALTDGKEGVFFFDTRDARRPDDLDGDGLYDNLTPAITVNGAGWHFRGLIYLNASRVGLDTTPSVNATLEAPAEPCQDADQDGEYEFGENWINLHYATALGMPCTVDRTNTLGGAVVHNERGPGIVAPVSLEGILFTNGAFEATGEGTIYGSVIAWEGVVQEIDDGSQPTPELYWNASISEDFPPPGWDLPRTVVTGWRARR